MKTPGFKQAIGVPRETPEMARHAFRGVEMPLDGEVALHGRCMALHGAFPTPVLEADAVRLSVSQVDP